MTIPTPLPPISDFEIEQEIRSIEMPHRVRHEGKTAIDWAGMRNRSQETFQRYIDLRNRARRRGLPTFLTHT